MVDNWGTAETEVIRRRRPGRRDHVLFAPAALAGLIASGAALLLCMSVALIAWFLADAGAHGDTTDALAIGVQVWLLGHGLDFTAAGLTIGLVPLAVTGLVVVSIWRSCQWATRGVSEPLPVRAVAIGAVGFVACYVVVALFALVLASSDADLAAGFGVSLLVSTVLGSGALAAGTGNLGAWVALAPAWIVELLRTACYCLLLVLAAGGLLAGVQLLVSINEAASLMSSLDLSVGDAVVVTVVAALTAPNAALFGAAWLLGSGFAVGTGTTVSPTVVDLGPLPAWPPLAALPESAPDWLWVVMMVPLLAAALGAGLTRSRGITLPLDATAGVGAAGGFVGGVLITLAVRFAGGPVGTGRLAEVGGPFFQTLVFATGLCTLGGLLGAVVTTWWRRRRSALASAA